MQMRRSYETTNKKLRASRLRKDGRELARAGFQDSADQNFELAAYIDPPVPQEQESNNESDNNDRVVPVRSRSNGANRSVAKQGITRRQDAAQSSKQPVSGGPRRAA